MGRQYDCEVQGFAVDGGIGSYRITKEGVSLAKRKACKIIRASRREKCWLWLHVYELGNKPRDQGSTVRVPECGFFVDRTYCLERIVYYCYIVFAVYTLYQRPHYSSCRRALSIGSVHFHIVHRFLQQSGTSG